MHNKLGLLLPTNQPETAFRLIYESINNLKEIAEYSTFLINYQKPWTTTQIQKFNNKLINLGFHVKFRVGDYSIDGPGLLPFNKMRDDCAQLLPNAKYYALIDDDMTFLDANCRIGKSAGQQYLDALDYLDNNEKCGIITFRGKYGKRYKHDLNCISPEPINAAFCNYYGMIARNIDGPTLILPHDSLELYGWGEEMLIALSRLREGYYPAGLNNARVKHIENSKDDFNVKDYNATISQSNKVEIAKDNNYKYIKEYNPEFSCKMGDYNIISNDAFELASGINYLNFEEFSKNNTIQY